ncbi:hypothetical protein ACFQ1S_35300, partial [Kibdelosporangium lantanae]
MTIRRSYGDSCAAAHALDLVGERWALTDRREDLDAVIDTLHTVLSIAPDTNVGWVRWSSNLAVALERRYRLTGAPDDLTTARELHRNACVEGADTDLAWSLHGARNWGLAAIDAAAGVSINCDYEVDGKTIGTWL